MLRKKEVSRKSREGQQLLEEIYNMRLENYTELGWNIFSKEKSKLIRDDFDESHNTTHFAILEKGKLIGSHRATVYSEEEGLPCFKGGFDLSLFKTGNTSVAELTRLILRQDRKYPGCVLQLAYNMIEYTLAHATDEVCTMGVASARGLFEFIGTRQVNSEQPLLVDQDADKMLIINTIPMLGNRSTLNSHIDFGKYHDDRTFVVIK